MLGESTHKTREQTIHLSIFYYFNAKQKIAIFLAF